MPRVDIPVATVGENSPHPTTSMDQDAMNKMSSTSDANLMDRLEFIQLDAKGRERIRQLKSIVDRELPAGLDKFYEKLRTTPEVRRFFETESHMARAKGAQVGHWSAISAGNFD